MFDDGESSLWMSFGHSGKFEFRFVLLWKVKVILNPLCRSLGFGLFLNVIFSF